ncbi:MAG TPA: enoyl-CoA hydratase/isomerase family protein [Candidatus Polarisedimenticolaceae bacterium]|nr:enoyl-CoA hydratase/isomerase family protein [Candidatus Polarisedimenticolaceae bacterium]
MSIHVTHQGAVTRITLDRPPLNVLTTAMMRAMADALDAAAASSDVRVVRLDAVGRAFCAGVDVGEHMGDALAPMMDALAGLFDAFERCPLPVVAVVQGAAVGGGCEVVLGADLCVASERATFGQPEIKLGVFAPPASVLLPRAVGERRALGLLLTGDTISAADAHTWGLVYKTAAPEALEATASTVVEGLAALSGTALRLAKQAVRAARGRSVPDGHAAVSRLYMDRLMTTRDAQEGLAAFLEKRAPVWAHE